MNGIFTEVRVGNVRLYPFDMQFARQRTTPAVLNHVTQLINRGGFTNHAVIESLTSLLEAFAHHYCAIIRGAFFVAGD